MSGDWIPPEGTSDNGSFMPDASLRAIEDGKPVEETPLITRIDTITSPEGRGVLMLHVGLPKVLWHHIVTAMSISDCDACNALAEAIVHSVLKQE
jgi:hypothetical protein